MVDIADVAGDACSCCLIVDGAEQTDGFADSIQRIVPVDAFETSVVTVDKAMREVACAVTSSSIDEKASIATCATTSAVDCLAERIGQ